MRCLWLPLAGMLVGLVQPAYSQSEIGAPQLELELGPVMAPFVQAQSLAQRRDSYTAVQSVLQTYVDIVPGAEMLLWAGNLRMASEASANGVAQALASLTTGDVNSSAQAVLELVASLAELNSAATGIAPTPSAAHDLFEAIASFDEASVASGLPSLRELVSEFLTDDPADLVTDFLDNVLAGESLYQTLQDITAGDDNAIDEAADALLELVPDSLQPVLGGPTTVVFVDTVRWTQEMTNVSAQAIDLVGNIIDTGQVDQQRLDQITARLNDLRTGPWGSDTAQRVVESWCDQLPVFGELCSALLGSIVDEPDDPALAAWQGWWSFRWGGIYIDVVGATATITPAPGFFLDREGGRMNVTSASRTVLAGTFTFEIGVDGTFRFELLPNEVDFIGTLDERGYGRSEIAGQRCGDCGEAPR